MILGTVYSATTTKTAASTAATETSAALTKTEPTSKPAPNVRSNISGAYVAAARLVVMPAIAAIEFDSILVVAPVKSWSTIPQEEIGISFPEANRSAGTRA